MTDPRDLTQLGEQGKKDFASGRYAAAADGFRGAMQGYAASGDRINAAEQRNNLGVTLLKLRRPQEALEIILGTDEIFASAGDTRRQGMALNNRAAALQDLGRADDALAAYERSAQLLGEAGEGEMRATALKAAAAIKLRRGRLTESGLTMLGALGSGLRPTWLERVLRSVLHRLR